ncbi:MAG TPA: hypothetical protein VH643_11925 [Gemmataceae bacterium]|jgi:hypothetical protein
MNAYLFNRAMTERFLLDVDEPDDEKSEHTFGGSMRYDGVVPEGSEQLATLLFRFDMRDACVGVKIPRVRWLPIFYPFGNKGGPFIYRTLSNRAIEMLCQPYPKSSYRRGVKFGTFPTEFPQAPVYLCPTGYDPKDLQDVDYCGGVLGVDGLSEKERATLLRNMNAMYKERYGDVYDPESDYYESLDDLVSECDPFTQGNYNSPCPVRDCVNHGKEGAMCALLCIDPEPDDPLYELIAGSEDGQLVFEICPKCHVVMAHNPIS